MPIDPVLANVPGLAGALAMRDYREQQQARQLEGVQNLMRLSDAFRAQDQEQRMRAELNALPESQRTPDALARIGAKYAKPDTLYHYAQGAQDRAAQIAATREQSLARLSQAAQIAGQNYQLRMRNLTRQEDRDAETARYQQERNELQAQAQRMTGERLFYDTGIQVPGVVGGGGNGGVPSPSGGSSAPSGAPAAAPAPAALPAGVPESDRAAYMAALAGGSGTVNRVMPQEETAGMQDMGALAPQQPQADTQQYPEPRSFSGPGGDNAREQYILERRQAAAMGARGVPSSQTSLPSESARTNITGLAQQQQQQGIAPAQAAAMQIPPMPPEIASAPKAVQNKWLLQQTRQGIMGGGMLTPQALEFTARQYLAGDRQAAQGYARNPLARIALQNAIVDEAAKAGLSPREVAAKMAEFQGTVAGERSVGVRSAQINLAATEAQEMGEILRETSNKFSRTNFVPWNFALSAYESNTGQPEVKELGAAINSFVNVYARAVNPTGVPTIQDKTHARELLRKVDSPQQVEAVLNILYREMDIAKRAPGTVREGLRRSITDGHTEPQGDARQVTLPDGRVKTFPTPAAADAFKRAAGIR